MTASAPAASSTGLPLPAPTRNQRTSLKPSATPSTSGQSPRTYPIGEQSGGAGEMVPQNFASAQRDTNRPNRGIAAHAATAARPPEIDAEGVPGGIVPVAEKRDGRGGHGSLGEGERR